MKKSNIPKSAQEKVTQKLNKKGEGVIK